MMHLFKQGLGRLALWFLISISLVGHTAAEHWEDTGSKSWEPLKQHPVPRWFDDAKFGIFIHWGPYSVVGYTKGNRGYAEWFPRNLYTDPEHYYPVMEERFGAHPPEFGYKDIIPLFKAEKWDPGAWAQLFREAGARYVVLTAEHHDGYALWDSELTPWNATKVGPMRDLVKELGHAVRQHDMKYALSYHRERHNGFFGQRAYTPESEPFQDIAREIENVPEAIELYGPFTIDTNYIKDYVARWKELETKYRPDFMWIDHVPVFHKRWNKAHDHPGVRQFRRACRKMIADYYESAASWGKGVYVNNKGPAGAFNWPEGVGCREGDNLTLDSIAAKWQNPATLGTSYGYMEWEDLNDAYKTPTELVHLLCDVVSKNGNLLLNIGPRSDGTIPAGMQRRLRAIGNWLQTNGEAIYGSRPWTVPGQSEPELRFTTRENKLYAIALEQASPSFLIELPEGEESLAVTGISLLGSDEPVDWERVDGGIRIHAPGHWPGEHAWAFRLSLAESR